MMVVGNNRNMQALFLVYVTQWSLAFFIMLISWSQRSIVSDGLDDSCETLFAEFAA